MTAAKTQPLGRSRLIAVKDLQEAVGASDARKARLVADRLRFVFGLDSPALFEQARAAHPDLTAVRFEQLLEEGGS